MWICSQDLCNRLARFAITHESDFDHDRVLFANAALCERVFNSTRELIKQIAFAAMYYKEIKFLIEGARSLGIPIGRPCKRDSRFFFAIRQELDRLALVERARRGAGIRGTGAIAIAALAAAR